MAHGCSAGPVVSVVAFASVEQLSLEETNVKTEPVQEETGGLVSMSVIARRIDELPLSADAKAILLDIAKVTVDVGGKLLRVGQRILTFVIKMITEFPTTSFGAMVALVVSHLIAAIPFFGAVLGPLLGPLLLALGLSMGALVDIRDRALVSRIRGLEREFAASVPGA